MPTEGSVLASLVVSGGQSTCHLALGSRCGEMDKPDVSPVSLMGKIWRKMFSDCLSALQTAQCGFSDAGHVTLVCRSRSIPCPPEKRQEGSCYPRSTQVKGTVAWDGCRLRDRGSHSVSEGRRRGSFPARPLPSGCKGFTCFLGFSLLFKSISFAWA